MNMFARVSFLFFLFLSSTAFCCRRIECAWNSDGLIEICFIPHLPHSSVEDYRGGQEARESGQRREAIRRLEGRGQGKEKTLAEERLKITIRGLQVHNINYILCILEHVQLQYEKKM